MIVIFTAILKMSVSASVIALIVMIARYFLRNSPKIYSYILWAAVLLRLICPFSLTLEIPEKAQAEPIPPTAEAEQANPAETIDYEGPAFPSAPALPPASGEASVYANADIPAVQDSEKPTRIAVKPLDLLTAVWLVGVAGMLGYMAWSYISLHRHVRSAVRIRGTVFKSDRINTAFVLGVISPKVYIPSCLSFDDAKSVILHEHTHIRRGDHIIKIIAFIALAAHWFNPIIWLSYRLMNIDMEHSCDEAVIEGLHSRGYKLAGVKRGYGRMLLALAIKDIKMPSVAFAESDVERRLSHILNYKGASFRRRKALLASCAAIVLLCALLPTVKGAEADAESSGTSTATPLNHSAGELDYSGTGLEDISFISDYAELVILDLSENAITDISPLADLPSLQYLYLEGNDIDDYSALASLTSLVHLSATVYDGDLSSLSALKDLPNLRGLTICCGRADGDKAWADSYDFSLLAEFDSLENLHIYAWDTECDLSFLAEMSKLSTLGLYIDPSSRCTLPDARHKTLTILYLNLPTTENPSEYLLSIASPESLRTLSVTTGEIDADRLTEYTELECLDLSLSEGIDFIKLKRLNKLWNLSFSQYSEEPADITGISELASVTSLSLKSNRLTDISPLGDMPQLVYLDLSENRIEDISPLSSLRELNQLYLCSNLVEDVSSLNCLDKLGKLALNDNPIEYSSIVNGIPDLTQCFIVSDRYESGILGIAPELPSEELEFEITDGEAYVTGYSGKDTEVVIPEGYAGCPVTGIADRAFSGSAITSIFMPNTILSIGDEAFFNCENLTDICWSQSLESLGEYCFFHCESLRELKLPDSLSTMGYSCFAECAAITEIHFPASLPVIPESCFSGCLSLAEVTIPKTVSEVSYHAFFNTPNLKEATVISGERICSVMGFSEGTLVKHCYETGHSGLVYEIIDGTAYVTGFTAVPYDESDPNIRSLPDTIIVPCVYSSYPVAGIADGAFSGEACRGIVSIRLSHGIAQIGDRTFSGCSGLKKLTLPVSIEYISPTAFEGCGKEAVVTSDKSEYLRAYFAGKDVEYYLRGEHSFG